MKNEVLNAITTMQGDDADFRSTGRERLEKLVGRDDAPGGPSGSQGTPDAQDAPSSGSVDPDAES